MGALGVLLSKLNLRSCALLEVGSYAGISALVWSSLIASACPDGGSVLCVDPWLPYMHPQDITPKSIYEAMDKELRDGSVFKEFQANILKADPRAPISFLRGSLNAVWEMLPAGKQFDVVYIDGNHAYSDVVNDCLNATLLVKPGGIVCGDDLERQYLDLDEAGRQVCEEHAERDYMSQFHPGVTLAVHETFGRVWGERGAWAVWEQRDGTFAASPKP